MHQNIHTRLSRDFTSSRKQNAMHYFWKKSSHWPSHKNKATKLPGERNILTLLDEQHSTWNKRKCDRTWEWIQCRLFAGWLHIILLNVDVAPCSVQWHELNVTWRLNQRWMTLPLITLHWRLRIAHEFMTCYFCIGSCRHALVCTHCTYCMHKIYVNHKQLVCNYCKAKNTLPAKPTSKNA